MPVPKVQICAEVVTAETAPLMVMGGVPMRGVCLGRRARDPGRAARRSPDFDPFADSTQPLPVSASWLNDAARKSIAMMLGNDQYGDCVIASAFHGIGTSSANESGAAILGTTNEAVSEYVRICGPGDNGCVITDVKDEMMRNGITIGGKRRKIDGYANINPANAPAVKTALLIAGGGVNIGFNVPSEWMGSNTYDGAVWDLPVRYSFVGGHDMRMVGFDERGVQFSTWGIVVTITWRALADNRIVDECYIELEEDWITDGTAPSGFKIDEFKAALAAFKAGSVPDWKPVSPPPVPPVPPSPPVPPTPAPTTITVTGRVQPVTVTTPARTITIPGLFGSKTVTIPGETLTVPGQVVTSTGPLPSA